MKSLPMVATCLFLSSACKAPLPQSPAVAASFVGGALREDQLESRGAAALFALRQEEYDYKTRLLEDMAFEKLLIRQAEIQKRTPEAILKEEIDDKVQPPTEEALLKARREIRQFRHLPPDESAARAEVLATLRQRDREKLFKAFRMKVLEEGGFQMELLPPRLAIPVRHYSPGRGPADAPITLTEFSDFPCTFCKSAQETLKKLWELYPDQVRHIWRAMPLDSKLSTQAALWTQAQGRFWAFRQVLYSTPGDLTPSVIKNKLEELQLDGSILEKSEVLRPSVDAVEQDLNDAKRLGLESAPSFFVNGRYFKGMPPLNLIAKVFNEELRRAGHPLTPEQKAAAKAD